MLLCDRDVRKLALAGMIDPYSESVQSGVVSYGLTSAGYDLRLGSLVWFFKNTYCEPVDPKRFKEEGYTDKLFDKRTYHEYGDEVYLPPHSYVLGYTLERLHIPDDVKGRVVGKSTLARCGIIINTTPLEPGWEGYLTLEIANVSPCQVVVRVGEGIAQLEIESLSGLPEITYAQKKGKYNKQEATPVAAKIKEESDFRSYE